MTFNIIHKNNSWCCISSHNSPVCVSCKGQKVCWNELGFFPIISTVGGRYTFFKTFVNRAYYQMPNVRKNGECKSNKTNFA